MRSHVISIAIAAALGLLQVGCGDSHVRECEGGVEILVAAPPNMLAGADRIRIEIRADGQMRDREFPASALDADGRGSLVVHFDVTELTNVEAEAWLLDAQDSVIAQARGSVAIEPTTEGCFLIQLMLGGPMVDASVGTADAGPDASVADARIPDDGGGIEDASPPPDAFVGLDGFVPPDDAFVPPDDAFVPPDAFQPMDAFSPPDDAFVPFDDGGVALDTDGDSIPNSSDNCPFDWNPSQHDEDNDFWGDVCDNCPNAVNPGQENDDLDGVGEACDPHPNDMLVWYDEIVGFEGFGNSLGGAVSEGGNWSVSNDQAVQSQTPGLNRLSIIDDVGHDLLTVRSRITVDSLAAQGTAPKGAGIHAFGNSGFTEGYRCLGRINMPDAVLLFEAGNMTPIASMGPLMVMPGNAVPASFTATRNMDATTTLSCMYGAAMATGVSSTEFFGDRAGVNTQEATARFDYVFVIGSYGAGP